MFHTISHRIARVLVVPAAFAAALAVPATAAAQIEFTQAINDLGSEDANVRLKTLRGLRDAAYPEAAVPISNLIIDKQDSVQLEAIAAELDIFLAEKVTGRKNGEPVVEKRGTLSAEAAFKSGPLIISLRTVPSEVLNALRVAAHDEKEHVALEALYAFGVLASRQEGTARIALQRVSADDLTGFLLANSSDMRRAAAQVIGRFYAHEPVEPPVDPSIGDALLAALNDKDARVRRDAMYALGAVRYEAAVQALTEIVNAQKKPEAPVDALDALARIASPSSVDLFKEQLTSKSIACRTVAVEGLARLRGTAKLADIQTALQKEKADEVQLAVSFAATMLADAPIDQLGEALVRPRLRDQARRYLVEVAPGHASRFSRHAMDPDNRIRIEVAEILTLAGDRSALPLVTPLASDQDPAVAFAGGRAVAQLRLAGARPAS